MGPARSDLLERGFRPVVIERWLRVYWDSLRRDTEGAKEHFREVLETYVETKSTANIAHVHNGFAMVANDEGKHERAARLLGAAARIRKESGGGAPPELMPGSATPTPRLGRPWGRMPSNEPMGRATL
jgi:hypothetical protein